MSYTSCVGNLLRGIASFGITSKGPPNPCSPKLYAHFLKPHTSHFRDTNNACTAQRTSSRSKTPWIDNSLKKWASPLTNIPKVSP